MVVMVSCPLGVLVGGPVFAESSSKSAATGPLSTVVPGSDICGAAAWPAGFIDRIIGGDVGEIDFDSASAEFEKSDPPRVVRPDWPTDLWIAERIPRGSVSQSPS